ncbi:MAG: GtrA family protein [Novosphingobium sp.]|jgi:putative flippase GtrA|uniref:GtrA family protein n=1 Tax=Novosphingobium sp. TaxID=1874826 RepID=UPI00391CE659|nr:GtrA family protein [Novosphingobium sp.]
MTQHLSDLLYRLRKTTVIRYGIASVGALAVDMGLFLALLSIGMMAAIASAIGYSAGIVAHWILSSRKVFNDNVAERGAARTRQKALFVVSALIGLALTTVIVGLVTALHGDPRLAKLVAIVVSFTATWLLRKHLVFPD